MSSPRILQVVPALVGGGAERFVVQLMLELDQAGFEVAAVSLYQQQGTLLEALAQSKGLKVRYLRKRRGFDSRTFLDVARAIREFKPDIIHTHLHALRYALPSIALTPAARAIHTVHSVAEREKYRIGRWMPRFLFPRVVVPVAVAREVQSSIRRVFRRDSVLIPNGIPIERYRHPASSREEWRTVWGFDNKDVLFVSVGRFDAVKNHRLLISAFARRLGEFEDVHLVLVGDGELRHQHEAQVEALRLKSRIHFLGVRSDIPELLGASDVFVFSSDHEGSPLSVMEAMAAGLPIVGTAVGGVPEIVPNGTAGLLVSAGNCEELADAMHKLYGMPAIRMQMGEVAAQYARHFNISVMAQSYAALYESLMAHPVISRSSGTPRFIQL